MTTKVENLAWRRANALVIDHFLVGFISVFILLPTIFTVAETIQTPQQLMTLLLSSIYTIPAVVLIFIFMVFYEPYCTYRYGWTLGKKICGLRVVNDNGKKLSFAMSAVRFIIKSGCLSVPYLNIVFVLISYVRQHNSKKMIWDEWIHTSVVLDR